MTLVPVMVIATLARALPAKEPPVKVIEPIASLPARILPLKFEVVRVAAPLGAQ